MPRTRSLAWSELKIGLLTVFALATATMLIFLLSGEGGFFWQRYSLKTVFPNIAGLKPGAPVRVAGVEVGLRHRGPVRGRSCGGRHGDLARHAAAGHLDIHGVARVDFAPR